jgi:hypothetical protein
MGVLVGMFGLALTGMLCVICPIIWFVIWILVAVWVYRDAEKRGASGVMWLLIVIILGIIGLIIYLIVRPKTFAPPPQGYAPPPGTPPPQ